MRQVEWDLDGEEAVDDVELGGITPWNAITGITGPTILPIEFDPGH